MRYVPKMFSEETPGLQLRKNIQLSSCLSELVSDGIESIRGDLSVIRVNSSSDL